MPSALIVGHTGQDGRILWGQLRSRKYSLLGLSRQGVRSEGMEWTEAVDISNLGAVRRLVAAVRPDEIYFLAAHHQSSQDSGADDVDLWSESWAVHVHAFCHFLESVSSFCPGTRVFYASSSRVFGEAETSPQDERTPLKPACVYGVTKSAGMQLADFFRRQHGVHVSCGILFNHESPLRGANFISQRIAEGLVAIRLGTSDRLEIGSLDSRVDWGYAPDFTLAMQMINAASSPDDYVVATGEAHSVREMIETAAGYLNMRWQGCVVETRKILTRPPQELRGNAAKLRAQTGWKPSIGFPELVKVMVDAAIGRMGAGDGKDVRV